ncbi:MAG: cyclic 2,3-diphosphoglycerate synthase [Pseudomonadota bacterium]
MPTRVVIMGAAGRDFHNFNMVYRDNPAYEVVAFTATQIPDIAGRKYPAALAGSLYPKGIPIVEESELPSLIEKERIGMVVFAYSDVAHEDVMHKASIAMAKGASFKFLGPDLTMIKSKKPVISVTAVRTGCGKSPVSQKLAQMLTAQGKRVAVLRHPMPYGDLAKQTWQRFGTLEDLEKQECTIEEMEEYEPHIRNGVIVFAGVDYQRILNEAEKEADVIIWDGGNNDFPFIRPDIDIVVTDPHRPNHELHYYPGEVNFRRAKILLITKIDSADEEKLSILIKNIKQYNPSATVIKANLAIKVEDVQKVQGKRVLVVEDGPTLTHGEMTFGAGVLAAKRFGAAETVDPKAFLVGKMLGTYRKYPFIRGLLPAMGYGGQQVKDLEETINRTPCDTVLIATPVDLRRILKIKHDTCRVTYELEEIGKPDLASVIAGLK